MLLISFQSKSHQKFGLLKRRGMQATGTFFGYS